MWARILTIATVLGYIHTYPQNIAQIPNVASPNEINSIGSKREINSYEQPQAIEDTVKEVEDLIKSNPELPRLTRGEILDILENLTRHDTLIHSVSKENYRDPKSLMVVKAYTPGGSGQINMEELYTKQPITSIIEDDDKPQAAKFVGSRTASTYTTTSTTIRPIVTTNAAIYFQRKSTTKSPEDKLKKDYEKKKPFRGNIHFKTSTSNDINITTEKIKLSSENYPTSPRNEIKRRRRPQSTTEISSVTTYHPRVKVMPSDETRHPNHKYPDEYSAKSPVYIPGGLRVVTPPQITPTEINSELEDLLPQEGEKQESFIPASPSIKWVSEPSIEVEIPDHLKKVVADLNLAAIKDSYPVVATSASKLKNETQKAQNVLSSIGIYPSSTTIAPAMENAQITAGGLSDDMQNLLKTFGLLPDPEKDNKKENEISSFIPERAEIRPESYVSFKPLPEDTNTRKEMESLLAQFGLLNDSSKKNKSPRQGREYTKDPKKPLEMHEISLDAVPDDLKPLLKEMGFDSSPRAGRKIREKPTHNHNEKDLNKNNVTKDKQHVFNPSDTEYVSEAEIQKLGKLLDVVKTLADKNGTITEEDMKKINQKELSELILSLNPTLEDLVPLNEQAAPNPVEYDSGLNKNEVKRQEVTTEKSESTTQTSSTEEAKTPSIKDLEDSFGGQSETVTEASEPETSPPPKPNGFYYLLDWNSFFEIDDQKGKRVNLRFQPKVGDPKRFFSVTVP